jgi:hypothetical protein
MPRNISAKISASKGQGMRQTRRQFVATTVAFGAIAATGARAATPPQPSGPPRMALDAFAADPSKLASLRHGIAVMKARDPSDHKSWFFQGAIHAYSDALYQDALSHDAKVAHVDGKRYWNRCPHFGQASADFVIWHRAYLHYFERVLREAAQDPDLSLPYWNYALPADRVFPDVFAAKFLDAQKTQSNSLYHPNRELAFVTGRLELSSAIGDATHTVGCENFFHEAGVPGLAGDHLDPDDTVIGLLEQRPHNDIHLAVGGVVNSANGAMAEITTPAFDPVFWVHHANNDRMWAAWSRVPGKRWGPMPADEWWDETPWVFLDVDGTEQSMSRRHYLELEATYDTVNGASLLQLAPKPLPPESEASGGSAPPMVGAAPPPRRHRGQRAAPPMMEAPPPPPPPPEPPPPSPPQQKRLLADAGSISFSPKSAAKRSINTAPPLMVGAAAPGAGPTTVEVDRSASKSADGLPAPETLPPDARVYLELASITFDRVPSSGFAVYLDRANAKSLTPLGLLDLFGATHAKMPGMAMMSASQRFDATRIVKSSHGPFTLRIEPYDLLVTKTGASPTQRRDAVHIGSVKFVVVS